MENKVISWLFETDAVRVCPQDQPFWYTSGKLGPFYINTQFLFGSEQAANELLALIEKAAGDHDTFAAVVGEAVDFQQENSPIFKGLIDILCEKAKAMDVDFISGGERRDFFFSLPVARRLGLPHLSIFKDLSTVYNAPGEKSVKGEDAGLAGKKSLHIADLVTEASSYVRAWIPAVEALGAKIAYSLAVVDRDQGGRQILENAGIPLTTLIKIDTAFFEAAAKMGVLTAAQEEMCLHFMQDPGAFMHAFLAAHPSFLSEQIAMGGKNKQRAELCIEKGFDKI